MPGRQLPENSAYVVASLAQRRAALATTLGLLAVALIAIPFGSHPLGEIDALLPAFGSATFVAMLVSAIMLRNQYGSTRYVPFAILSVAYSTTALLLVPYMLTFPHLFSPTGFSMGPQVTPWLWVTWHAAFIMLMGGYAWSDSFFQRKNVDPLEGAEFLRLYTLVATVIGAAAVTAIICFHSELPVLVAGSTYTPLYHLLVEQLLLASSCVVMATLIARNVMRYTTHLWLLVVLAAFTIEIGLNADIVSGRFTVAWYMGFFEAAVWQCLFLGVQLRHLNEQLLNFATTTEKLTEKAHRDALTGLYNRRAFDERLELAVAEGRTSNATIAILLLDLDHFKAYNDHFGHLAGDDALREVARAMSSRVNRPADACCRVGGEEFAIILAPVEDTGALTVAERVRMSVQQLRIRHAPQIDLPGMTVSIGVAVANSANAAAVATLYQRADQALYRAKAMGRNRVISHSEGRDANLRIV
jgi:diguanylate cyclase (GGDEF)-like protein